jgi:hypothetical protein
MTIPQIEQEYEEPIDKVIKDLLAEDYMGCALLRPYQIANLFHTSGEVINNLIKKHKISFNKYLYFPTKTEDKCWVRYGITLKHYLKTRSRYLTTKEMAEDIGVHQNDVKYFMKKYKIWNKYFRKCWFEYREECKTDGFNNYSLSKSY